MRAAALPLRTRLFAERTTISRQALVAAADCLQSLALQDGSGVGMPPASPTQTGGKSSAVQLPLLLPLPVDASLLSSSGPPMVVLLQAVCDLGAPALASEALDTCYLDVSSIPYEVLWAALQAHGLARRSGEARQLLLAWLAACDTAPTDVAAHDRRIFRLVRLMLTRVLDSGEAAAEGLLRDVAPRLSTAGLRDELWKEFRPPAKDEAASDAAHAPAAAVANADPQPAPRASNGTAKEVRGPSSGTSGGGASAAGARGGAEATRTTKPAAQPNEEPSQAAPKPTPSEIRNSLASLLSNFERLVREAMGEMTETAMRRSSSAQGQARGAVAAALGAVGVLLLLRRRKRATGWLLAALQPLLQQANALVGMLLGGGSPVIRTSR